MNEGNELFSSIIENEKLEIKLNGQVTTLLWNKYGGVFNDIINGGTDKHSVSQIIVSLCSCDELNLMALIPMILCLIKVKRERNCKIHIKLPEMGKKGQESEQSFNRGKQLKMLTTRGFLHVLRENFTVTQDGKTITDDDEEKFLKYGYDLSHLEDVLFPLHVFECANISRKEEIVSQVIEYMESHSNTDIISVQVYHVINELVENAIRHAYKDEQLKLFAVFLRQRRGWCNNKIDVNRKSVEEDKAEKKSLPTATQSIFQESENFVEIYFSDIGIGLSESLQDYFDNSGAQYKYPFRELFRKVLVDGIRCDSKNAVTAFGGLHFLCRLMNENGGYIWSNEGNQCIYASASDLVSKKTSDNFALQDTITPPPGLSWCFRFPISENIPRREFVYHYDKDVSEHPVVVALKDYKNKTDYDKIICFDEKRNKLVFIRGSFEKWSEIDLDECKEGSICLSGVITVVWIPYGNHSKNSVGEILCRVNSKIKLMGGPGHSQLYWIISDIEPSRFFSYYFTLNGFSLVRLGMLDIKGVILNTCHWETAYFIPNHGVLINNKEMTERYYNDAVVSNCLFFHIQKYANFIRDYDSYLFWNEVRRNLSEKIYIKAEIVWEKLTLDGYLDLERAYLYENAYSIIFRSLERIRGLCPSDNVGYHFVDQTVARICRDLNIRIARHSGSRYIINVCGACVTGNSFKSCFKEKKPSIDTVLFVHPYFDNRFDLDSLCLFLWPNDSFFDSFEKEKDIYYRLGRTSLISRNKDELLINPIGDDSTVIRSKRDMYYDFQQEMPRIVKYGHYTTDSHHYLIGFDFLSFIRHSFMKRDGIFVFFLWKILDYLSDNNIEKTYKYIKDQEWIKALKACDYKSDKHGRMVVYHANTCTEYIMGKIKEIVSSELLTCIMPINMYEIQAKGSPITISPFDMDRLRQIYSSPEKKGILFIDSTASTGRKKLEIENILLQVECEEVLFLSIADFRRLRNIDEKNTSFWRINIPRLDDEGPCVICEALKRVDFFSKKVTQEKSARLLRWREEWACSSIYNSPNNIGMDKFDEELVNSLPYETKIKDSIALNLFVSELLCESYNNNVVYEIVSSNKFGISNPVRMQLICSQFLLYGNQYSKQLQLSLLSLLVKLLAESPDSDSTTSLAGLVILSQKQEVIYELLNEILVRQHEKRADYFAVIKEDLLGSTNDDLLLSIGYFVYSSNLVEQLINGVVRNENTESVFLSSLNDLILPRGEYKLIFREFEGLYVNEMGGVHNTNLSKLLKEPQGVLEDYKKRCKAVQNDVKRLADLTKLFPVALINSISSIKTDKYEIGDLVRELNSKIRDDIDYKTKKESDNSNCESSQNVKDAINKCKIGFDIVLENYYIKNDEKSRSWFNDAVSKCEKECKKKIDIEISPWNSERNKYYFWNSSIEKEFLYLIYNVQHCSEVVSEDTSSVMKVRVVFEPNHINICTESWSEISENQVKSIFFEKNRFSKDQAISFDVIFDFKANGKRDGLTYLVSQMQVPACYTSLKGD